MNRQKQSKREKASLAKKETVFWETTHLIYKQWCMIDFTAYIHERDEVFLKTDIGRVPFVSSVQTNSLPSQNTDILPKVRKSISFGVNNQCKTLQFTREDEIYFEPPSIYRQRWLPWWFNNFPTSARGIKRTLTVHVKRMLLLTSGLRKGWNRCRVDAACARWLNVFKRFYWVLNSGNNDIFLCRVRWDWRGWLIKMLSSTKRNFAKGGHFLMRLVFQLHSLSPNMLSFSLFLSSVPTRQK